MKLCKTTPLVGLVLLATLLLAACGPKEAEVTPTLVDVGAIQTGAVQTVLAGQTSTALAMPTATFTPSPTNTMLPPPTPASVSTVPAAPVSTCDNSAYIKDVTIPDGTSMNPGQKFTKTWLVSNTGTCTWTATYKIGFGFGEAMGGAMTPIGKSVEPGGQAEVSVELTAPAKSGSLTSNWRLFNDKGEAFGTWLSAVIQVSGPTAASTEEATETPEPTETPTATP